MTTDSPMQSETSISAADAVQVAARRAGELLRQCAIDDLPVLGQIHDALGQIGDGADKSLAVDRAKVVRDAAVMSMKCVEQIILREADDLEACLASVKASIAQIQFLADGTSTPRTSPPSPSGVAPASTPAQPAPASVEQTALREDDLPLLQEFIAEATTHIETAEAALLQLEEDPTDTEAINSVFRSFHTVKGVAGFLNLVQITSLAHAAENVLDRARKGKLQLTSAVADVILQSVDALRKLLDLLRPVVETNGGMPGDLDGLSKLIERLQACAHGEETAPVAAPVVVSASIEFAKAAVCETQAEAQMATKGAGDSTIKVSTERLDALINMVGELVIAQAMVGQDIAASSVRDRRAVQNLAHLTKITHDLQDLSMSMRMVPIQGVFQKMARLLRDLARKAGKEIDLVVQGGETELDRNVVEAISDPLVHMVRNAADHGIEAPEDRVKSGKPARGTLTLKAYHQAGNIVIDITDDGRGLNKTRIRRKAIDNGLIREDQELGDQEIFQLIFAAGLSTAEKITDVSGRGVGMDVVKRNVEALRGRIDIASTAGLGATFTIRLPLTLAVIDGLIVKVGCERYIIPITSIEQSLRPRKEQLSTVQGRGELCMVRSSLVPIVRLHRLFNLTPVHESPTDGLLVIVQNGATRCALLVDELLGQQQVVIKSLGATLASIRGIAGGAILGDGNVSLILDVPGILACANNE